MRSLIKYHMITDEYKRELARFHATNAFGYNFTVPQAVHDLVQKHRPKTVLDYGCATGPMVKTMRETYPDIETMGYDPAVPEFQHLPDHADLTYCLDCLEHIEPLHLDSVLDSLFRVTRDVLYLEICCTPAKKILSDGRNAHLIQEQPDWWRSKLSRTGWTLISDDTVERDPIRPGLWPSKHYHALLHKIS